MPGDLSQHLAAIGLARLLEEFHPSATTCFGPAEPPENRLDRPTGFWIWTVQDAGRVMRFARWLGQRQWTFATPHDRTDQGRVWHASQEGGTTRALHHLLGLADLDAPLCPKWLQAFGRIGAAVSGWGVLILGSGGKREPSLPALQWFDDGWAFVLPYWHRRHWQTLEVVLSSDISRQSAEGDPSWWSRLWAVYAMTATPVAELPRPLPERV
jgi:hypothetical protein